VWSPTGDGCVGCISCAVCFVICIYIYIYTPWSPRRLHVCKLSGRSAYLSLAYLGLSRLISSHITLFILPAEHYSSNQPNKQPVRLAGG
jgi:hypothetical protein